MTCLIYQYWSGDVPNYAKISSRLFAEYAEHLGAQYRFDENPDFFRGKFGRYFNALRPLYDPAFHQFEKVLFVDADVYPRQGLTRSIFDEACPGIAMAQEEHQPSLRAVSASKINGRNDKRWARIVRVLYGAQIPSDASGRPLVYNSGVVLYSGAFLKEARRIMPSPKIYQTAMRLAGLPRFYGLDQNYLQMASSILRIPFADLPSFWNHQVHKAERPQGDSIWHDLRTPQTCFTHYQVRDRSGLSEQELLDQVTLLPEA